jgi:hypothetical protein
MNNLIVGKTIVEPERTPLKGFTGILDGYLIETMSLQKGTASRANLFNIR